MIAAHPPQSGSIWMIVPVVFPCSAQHLSHSLKTAEYRVFGCASFGQTIGAEQGTLTVMIGGDATAFERAKAVIQAFAGKIEHVGESGAGFAVKAINNSLMAANLWALSEGLSVLKARGVNLEAALACINHSW
jgi:3-hydroxyisobutyrate dehydrogenase